VPVRSAYYANFAAVFIAPLSTSQNFRQSKGPGYAFWLAKKAAATVLTGDELVICSVRYDATDSTIEFFSHCVPDVLRVPQSCVLVL